MHVAIIGAGPIGLEAALAVLERGHTATVYERGRVAENVRDWGHVRLFTPFGMNTSERGRAVLRDAGVELPDDDAILTGREFVEAYLAPLAESSFLADVIQEDTDVVSIGRQTFGKRDAIGRPERAEDGFRLIVRERGDTIHSADVVFDCSGTYPNHRWLGIGGTPAQEEQSSGHCIDYTLPDVLGSDRVRFANKRTLVVGSGYSAATTVVALGRLAVHAPRTRVIWLTRPTQIPVARTPDDPLVERDRLAVDANELAVQGGAVEWLSDLAISAIVGVKHIVAAELRSDPELEGEFWEFDNVVANVGYKPDRSIYEELQVHECYASQGPMKLAASLLGEATGDCLAVPAAGPEVLRNPEPNFYILGSKSYGRDSRFLLRTGLRQVEDVLTLLD